MADLPLKREAWGPSGTRWLGSAEQLIAAGIVRRDQLPGERGNGIFGMTFVDGKRITRGCARDAHMHPGYLRIERSGHRFVVWTRGTPEAFGRFMGRVLDERCWEGWNPYTCSYDTRCAEAGAEVEREADRIWRAMPAEKRITLAATFSGYAKTTPRMDQARAMKEHQRRRG